MAKTAVLRIDVQNERALGKLTRKLGQLTKERRLLTKAVQGDKKALDQLGITQAQAADRLGKLNVQVKATRNNLRDLEASILKSNNALRKQSGFVAGVRKGVTQAASSFIGVTAAIGAVVSITQRAIRVNKEISDSLADVRKTTGLTQAEVEGLADSLKRLNTRTSLQGLLRIAEAGGRLNVAAKDLARFVEVVDKAVVALGDELSGSEEEIATTLAKISDLFNLDEQFDIATGIEKVGSAINELGANTKAQSQFIIDVTSRLQGLGQTAGVSVSDILGLSATLDELGLNSEASSTAVTKLFIQLSQDVPKFAQIAGRSVEDFSNILREDANEAFLLVLEGARSNESGLLALGEVLQSLGINSARSAQTIAGLSTNVDQLRQNQELANDAFKEGTSLQEEFAIKNNTLAASLDKLNNAYDNTTASSGLFSAVLSPLIITLAQFIDELNAAPVVLKRYAVGLKNLSSNEVKTLFDDIKGRTEDLKLTTVGQFFEDIAKLPASDIRNNLASIRNEFDNIFSALTKAERNRIFETYIDGLNSFEAALAQATSKESLNNLLTDLIEQQSRLSAQPLIGENTEAELEAVGRQIDKVADAINNLRGGEGGGGEGGGGVVGLTEKLKELKDALKEALDAENISEAAVLINQISALEARIDATATAAKRLADQLSGALRKVPGVSTKPGPSQIPGAGGPDIFGPGEDPGTPATDAAQETIEESRQHELLLGLISLGRFYLQRHQ